MPVVWSSAPLEPFVPAKVLLLTLLACAAMAMRASDILEWARSLPGNAGDLRVALLAGWAMIAALAAPDSVTAITTIVGAIPYLAIFALLRTSAASRAAAVQGALLAGAVNIAVGLGQLLHMPIFLFGTGEEPIGLIGNRNHLAAFLAMLLPLLGTGPSYGSLSFRLGYASFGFLVLMLTRSRGAMLALLAASALPALSRGDLPADRRRRVAAALGIAVLLISVTAAGSPTGQARAYTWSMTARAALARPIVGHGPGSFENVFPALQEARFRDIDTDEAKLAAADWRYTRNHRDAHNDWLEAVFELGFPAGFLMLFLFAEALRNRQAGPAPRAAAMALGIVALSTFPFQVVPAALLATLVLSLALPAWAASSGESSEPWPLWPKLWLILVSTLLCVDAAATYAAAAAHGQARRLFEAGKIEAAEKAIGRSLYLKPRDGRAIALAARILEKTGRSEAALKLFERAAEHHLDVSVVINQAVTLRALGKKEEAFAKFRRAVWMLPTSSDAWYFLALAHAEAGRKAEAARAMDMARQLSVENYKAWLDAARLAEERGSAADAEKRLRENIDYLEGRLLEEDPTARTVDPVKREYLALNAQRLGRILGASGHDHEKRRLEARVARFFPPSPR